MSSPPSHRRERAGDAALARHDALEAATPEGLAYLQQLDPMYVWLPVGFTMVAIDNNGLLPAVFSLTLTDGYTVTGPLTSGTLQIQ